MQDVIVFDGVCHLCNRWVQFLLPRDPQGKFRFAAMQGASGKNLLLQHGLDPNDPVSFLYLSGGKAWTDSDAIIRVLSSLGGFWKGAKLLYVLPGFLRNALYRTLARNRYRWFGKSDSCMRPAAGWEARFLP
jgi:predicted DCC family thiol-disulfide oxidoreductase YuxK